MYLEVLLRLVACSLYCSAEQGIVALKGGEQIPNFDDTMAANDQTSNNCTTASTQAAAIVVDADAGAVVATVVLIPSAAAPVSATSCSVTSCSNLILAAANVRVDTVTSAASNSTGMQPSGRDSRASDGQPGNPAAVDDHVRHTSFPPAAGGGAGGKDRFIGAEGTSATDVNLVSRASTLGGGHQGTLPVAINVVSNACGPGTDAATPGVSELGSLPPQASLAHVPLMSLASDSQAGTTASALPPLVNPFPAATPLPDHLALLVQLPISQVVPRVDQLQGEAVIIRAHSPPVPHKLADRIWRGEYTEMQELLASCLGLPEPSIVDVLAGKLRQQSPKTVSDIYQWVQCFNGSSLTRAGEGPAGLCLQHCASS